MSEPSLVIQFDRPVTESEMEAFKHRWLQQHEPERDYLAEALAAEEHRQGAAYGDAADHCGECAAEALRRRQAACEHANVDVIDMLDLCGSRTYLRTCRDCGLDLSVTHEVVG